LHLSSRRNVAVNKKLHHGGANLAQTDFPGFGKGELDREKEFFYEDRKHACNEEGCEGYFCKPTTSNF